MESLQPLGDSGTPEGAVCGLKFNKTVSSPSIVFLAWGVYPAIKRGPWLGKEDGHGAKKGS